MRVDRRPRRFTLALFLAGSLAAGLSAEATPWSLPPQEGPPTEAGDASKTRVPGQGSPNPADERSPADRSVAELSDAERLLRMQQVGAYDETKLERLRTDLASRRAFLDELTAGMAELQDIWDEKKAGVEALDAGSEEAASLQEEIGRIERRYERINRHATLTFEAEEALRKQIRGLESKITTDRRALAVFRGRLPDAAPAEQPAVQVAPSQPPVPSEARRVVSPIPGMPLTAPATAPAPAETADPLLPETPQLIEARVEAAKKQGYARTAEQAVVTFVKRKEALEEQIRLEKKLLQVDEEALENLRGYQQEHRAWLEEGTASEEGLALSRRAVERSTAEIARVGEEVARRRDDVTSLEERLEYAIGEQERVSALAEDRRQEAESARKWMVWLGSPLYPANLARWAVERGPRVLAVLLLAGFLVLLLRVSLQRVARAVVTQSRKARSSGVNRADTLASSFKSVATTLILMACVLLVLQEAGLDVKTVLGGAAILGVAIAFGAQNLMRDYFTGFMMLLEDQYELGDLVTIGSITGTVERVNMRITMLRDLEGRVHFIPNGQIGSLTNRTYDWARALVEVPVGPEEDVDRAMAVMLEAARGLNADPKWADEIVDEPQMLGVDKFTESGVSIKLMLKTHPERMFPVRRELLRRVKRAFDEAGIEPGFPVRVVRQRPVTKD